MNKYKKSVFIIIFFLICITAIFSINYASNDFGELTTVTSNSKTVSFSKDGSNKYLNEKSFKIENTDFNNSAFVLNMDVENYTPYKVSAMVKVQDIECKKDIAKQSGVKIYVQGVDVESKCITDNCDWQEVSVMFNALNYNKVSIKFMLGDNVEQGAAKGKVWFSDIKVTKGEPSKENTWNVTCLAVKNTDVQIGKKNYSFSLSENDIKNINDNMLRFKESMKKLSNNQININYNVVEVNETLKSLSYDEEKGYYISYNDISSLENLIDGKNVDHIFVCARLSNEAEKSLIGDWLGLGSMKYKEIGFSNIRMATAENSYAMAYSEKNNKFPEEVFVHEFLHTLEHKSMIIKNSTVKLHDYEIYGYKKDKLYGLYDWYKCYLQDNINGKKIGISKDVFFLKPIHEEAFLNQQVVKKL